MPSAAHVFGVSVRGSLTKSLRLCARLSISVRVRVTTTETVIPSGLLATHRDLKPGTENRTVTTTSSYVSGCLAGPSACALNHSRRRTDRIRNSHYFLRVKPASSSSQSVPSGLAGPPGGTAASGAMIFGGWPKEVVDETVPNETASQWVVRIRPSRSRAFLTAH